MRRRYRWLIAALVTIVTLPTVAVIAVLLWIDPDDLRAGAERSAREQLGLPLTLQGDLHWSWWPLFAIDAGAGEIAGSDNAPLLSWQRLQLGAYWRALLNQQYLIERITVDGLTVQLRRDTAGRGNWQSLFNSERGGTTVHIRQLRVTDSTISFSDAATGHAWRATSVNTTLDLGIDAATTMTLTKPVFAAQLAGSGIAAGGVPIFMKTDRLTYQSSNGAIEMAPLQLRIANLEVSVAVSGPLQLAPLAGAGTLELKSDSVRSTLTALGISLPPMRDAKVLGAATVSTQWQLGADNATFSKLRIAVDDTSVHGVVSWPLVSNGEISMDLHGDTLNADRYMDPADKSGEPFELPVKELRALRLRGSLSLDALTLRGVTARDTRIRFED